MKNGTHCLALLGAMMLAGCMDAATATPSTSGATQAAIGPATVTTDKTSYTFATPVTVSFAGLDGSTSDWLAIAPQGSPLSTTTRWAFTGGGATGTHVFEGPGAGGTYVARAFDASSALLGESDPFTVQDPGSVMATVTPGKSAYTMAENITISFTGMPGDPQDWIAIAPVGFPDDDQAEWRFTGGGASGSVTFTGGFSLTGFPAGNYVARAYLNNTFTKVAESAMFTIGLAGPTISTDRTTYSTTDDIAVSWTALPGNLHDWIAIAPQGSPPTTVQMWVYANGQVAGSTSFFAGNLAVGNYVARAFNNDAYTLLAESVMFSVTTAVPAGITTNKSTYARGETITITWNGLSTNNKNWISYAPQGSPDTTVTRWAYTGGLASGSLLFEGPLAAGTYVARSFSNDTYTKTGESAPFVVP